MKTYRFLKAESVDPAVVQQYFGGKARVELVKAIHNPDHSAAAVQILRAMLKAQGMTDEQIALGRWNINEMDALPLSKGPSLEQALQQPKRWRAIYRGIQILCLLMVISGGFSGYLEDRTMQNRVDELIEQNVVPADKYREWRESGVFKYQPDVSEYRRSGYLVIAPEISVRTKNTGDLNERVLRHYGHSQDIPGHVLSVMLVLGALVLFTPFKLAMWWWPARILLLRPFNTKDVSKSLKRFIRRNVIFSGHVFTLADQHMKESLFLYLISFVPLSPEGLLMLFLYPWVKRSRRRIYIKKASDFRALQKRLGSRWLLNGFWTNSWRDKIRKVRTVDRWWQRCIDLLAVTSDVILIDLTLVKAGTRWELSTLRDRELEEKAIFIVQQEQLEHAQAVLAEYWPNAALPRIYAYDEKGQLESHADFAYHFAHVISLPRQKFNGKPRLHFWSVFSLFIWWYPIIGLPIAVYAWATVSRSAGRLKGKSLAVISTVLNILVLGALVWALLSFYYSRP